MPQTKLAILLWNQQLEFPKNEIITKDTVTIHSNIQQYKLGEAITYNLEKVENNIAYINFLGKSNLANNSQTKIQGNLEYDIRDKYFRLIQTKRTTNLSQAETTQNNLISVSQDSTRNYLIEEISKIKKLTMH